MDSIFAEAADSLNLINIHSAKYRLNDKSLFKALLNVKMGPSEKITHLPMDVNIPMYSSLHIQYRSHDCIPHFLYKVKAMLGNSHFKQ